MIEEKHNLNHFWEEVNQKLVWIWSQTKDDARLTHYLLEKIFKNDQILYGKVNQIDTMGWLTANNSIVIPTNIEKNIDTALTAIANNHTWPENNVLSTSSSTSNTPDHVIDPILWADSANLNTGSSTGAIMSDASSQPETPASEFAAEDDYDLDAPVFSNRNIVANNSASSDDGYHFQ